MKYMIKKRLKSALLVAAGVVLPATSFAADKITVDMPEMDFATITAWIAGFVVVSLSITAMFFGMRRGNKAMGG